MHLARGIKHYRALLSGLVLCALVLPSTHHARPLTRANSVTDNDDLVAATYLGGTGDEGGVYAGAIQVAVATTGDVYTVGMTASTDFPTTEGAYSCVQCGGKDIFVARLSEDLSTLLAATVIGGSQDEFMPSLAISSDGSVYVIGYTNSVDFPTTSGAYDRSADSGTNIFVTRFDAGLTTLLAATFLGGDGQDLYPTVDLDAAGNPIICGVTVGGATNSFPTTTGAYDRVCSPQYPDFFVSRLSADLSQLLASTFLGGRYEEAWGGAVVDPWGSIIVGGATESDDYPTTPGAYQESFNGPAQPGQYLFDVVVSRLSGDLTTLLASTFIGTSVFDAGQEITLGINGDVIVGGHTEATDYPVTAGALDPDHNGQNEYFLTRIDNDLTTILASTFLTPDDAGFVYLTDLATDAEGNIYGTGAAWEPTCPTTPGAFDTTFNGGASDIMMMKFSGDLTTLEYSTFLGGTGQEGDCAVAVRGTGEVVTAGYTTSPDMPATPGAYDENLSTGTKDAFVARFHPGNTPTPVRDRRVPDAGLKILNVYPNPTNRDATVSFSLASTQRVEIDVYDVTGRRVARVGAGVYPPGVHSVSWSGSDADGHRAASGFYFFDVKGKGDASVRKFVLAR